MEKDLGIWKIKHSYTTKRIDKTSNETKKDNTDALLELNGNGTALHRNQQKNVQKRQFHGVFEQFPSTFRRFAASGTGTFREIECCSVGLFVDFVETWRIGAWQLLD